VDKSDTVYPPDSEKAVDDLLTEDYWSNYYPFRDMQEVAVEEPDSLPDLVSFPSIVDDGYIDNEGTTFYRWGGSPPTRHAFRGGGNLKRISTETIGISHHIYRRKRHGSLG
jgi:hypothetical protein